MMTDEDHDANQRHHEADDRDLEPRRPRPRPRNTVPSSEPIALSAASGSTYPVIRPPSVAGSAGDHRPFGIR